ncbi:hypothetical protein [Muribaculum intestinale]|nr:hypothetical protein [Muribaculum intestinale]
MTANNTNIAPAKYRLGGPMAWWVWILVTVFTIYLFRGCFITIVNLL